VPLAVEVGGAAWQRHAARPEVRSTLAAPLALARWCAGDASGARRVLEPWASVAQPPVTRAWTLAALAFLAAHEPSVERCSRHASEAASLLEELGPATAPELATAAVAVAHAQLVAGDLTGAVRWIADGLAGEERRPGSLGHVLALAVDAEVAFARADCRRALDQIRRAREAAQRLVGADELRAWLDRIEADVARRAGDPLLGSPPSDAELRVLRLLDSDLSWAEIADELYLTRNTVKSHVRRIYRRLGVRARGDAVRAARRRDLPVGDGASRTCARR